MELTIQIELPERAANNRRTRALAESFEMGESAGVGRRTLLAPTTLSLSAGQVAYLVGPSGAGKSQLLSAIARGWPRRPGGRSAVVAGSLADPPPRPRAAVLDVVRGQLARTGRRGDRTERALRALSAAGLGEARLWLMRAGDLSAGQADRLALACLFARADRKKGTSLVFPPKLPRRSEEHDAETSDVPFLLLIDEFGSRLDRLTAAILAANLRRWVRRAGGAAAVVATAHDDLADALDPDWIWIKNCEDRLRVLRGTTEGN